jgi:pyruvate formate lyase activating enzyme
MATGKCLKQDWLLVSNVKMIISGLVKSSIIDYPKKIAAIVFTHGCNFRCGYCHNPELVISKPKKQISEDQVIEFLESRKSILDGLVVTGGEPLIYNDIEDFLKKVKALGYQIKLDTNGINPILLENLIDKKLVDYVAMDIKTSLDKYSEVVGVDLDTENIAKSINLIMLKAPDYEFRSTLLPRHHDEDTLKQMAVLIKGAKKFYIQNFRNSITLRNDYSLESPFTRNQLKNIEELFINYVESCSIRDNI